MKITRKRAIELKCWDCQGEYVDGKEDCEVTICPLYEFMPYRKKEPKTDLFEFNPKTKGRVPVSKKELSEEEKQSIRDRFTQKETDE